MSYPITPNPSIHRLPDAIAKQQALAESQAIHASAKRMVEGLINAILWHLSHGLLGHNPDTQQTVTPSASASGYMSAFYNKAVIKPIDHSRIPIIPSSHIANSTPNILTGGDFPNVNSVDTSTGFVWDSSTDHSGVSGSGSAMVAANGSPLILASPLVPVSQDDQLTASGWVQWSGVTASAGTALQLSIVSYDSGGGLLGSTVVASLPASGTLGASGTWQQMTGTNYPVAAGVASVSVQVAVTAVVTAGSLWFDDLSLVKTGPIGGHLVSGLTGIGSTIKNDLQSSLNAIGQAIFGGLGNHTPGSVNAGMLAIPQENIVIIPNPSSTGVTFDAVGTGWTTATTASSSSLSVSGSHNAAGNFAVVTIAINASASLSKLTRTVTYGGVTMGSLGFRASSDGLDTIEVFGLFNPPTGAQTVTATVTTSTSFINSLVASSVSYSGVTSLGAVTTVINYSSSISYGATSASTNNRFFNAFLATNSNSAYGSTTTLGSYSQTSRFNSGSVVDRALLMGDAATTGSLVTFSAVPTSSPSGSVYWVGIIIELESNSGYLGSGFRAARASTSNVASSTGTNLAPSSFFTAGFTGNTSDYSYNTSTHALTVSQAGWYAVKICYRLPASTVGATTFGPVLYQNGSVVQYGGTTYYPGLSASPVTSADTFFVYLNAGDYIQPGYSSDNGKANGLTGDTFGTYSYWSVTLCNRSLM